MNQWRLGLQGLHGHFSPKLGILHNIGQNSGMKVNEETVAKKMQRA